MSPRAWQGPWVSISGCDCTALLGRCQQPALTHTGTPLEPPVSVGATPNSHKAPCERRGTEAPVHCLSQLRYKSGKEQGTMADYRIREYRDEDYEVVRELFATGMSEYVPALCVHVLKQPWVILVLACTFCILLTSSKSLLLPILAITLLLATGRQLLGYFWTMYIEHCLKEDLLDIKTTYMGSKGSCFWVAEADECVVGTVAARPSDDQEGELMLKRMSVRKDYRGLGVAKALCQAVICFAQQQGCRAVVLNTLMVQDEARLMYEHVGFAKYHDDVLPTVYGRLANVTISKYRYSVPRRS
ncbi:probable N-acetyltransferase camello isoform X1 [Gopherus flavomarginatus]|uniref:probable N-acetyltransferase camello isoform X1 n=2 Tax=Gopherus flavomarginatus TaxID=286002 RepID=UPI0021CC1E84|nr:probable N-acetyltransferase camello isoform X1 [Gopherus flavomarginatus]